MLRGILPKEYAFFDFFEEMTATNIVISEVFIRMVEGKQDMQSAANEIRRLERQNDKAVHSCTDLLHRTFITPIDREDIFDLMKALDGFADNVHAAAYRLSHYNISEIFNDTIEFAKIMNTGIIELDIAVKGLRKIKHTSVIRDKCLTIHELENDSDDILRKAVSNLFLQNDILLLIKWKEIFERLEKAVDRLERAASVIETILIANS